MSALDRRLAFDTLLPHRYRRAMIRAMLLIGPTGSGKTPLGDAIEADGLGDGLCVHFDFGRHLRRAADRCPGPLCDHETAFVRRMLAANGLLEDEHFHIAERLLRAFLDERHVWPGTFREPSDHRVI